MGFILRNVAFFEVAFSILLEVSPLKFSPLVFSSSSNSQHFHGKFMNTFTLKYFRFYICAYFCALQCRRSETMYKSWNIVNRSINWINLPLLRTLHLRVSTRLWWNDMFSILSLRRKFYLYIKKRTYLFSTLELTEKHLYHSF